MLDLTLDTLRCLVACDTTNPPRAMAASGIIAYVEDRLRAAGFELQCDDLGDGCFSIFAMRGSPRGLFNVHLDTVPASGDWANDPFDLHVTSDRAIGLGACDIKGAAASLLAAASSTTGPAAILLTTDEEAGDSRCVRTFLRDVPDFLEYVIVAEPTNCRAVTSHRGLQTFEGTFTGVASHSSSDPAAARSAVHDAARWTQAALDAAQEAEATCYDGLSGIRFNVGVLEGGVKANVIAPSARVVFGLRPLPGHNGSDFSSRLFDLAPPGSDVNWQPRFAAPALTASDAACTIVKTLGLKTGPALNCWTEAALFADAGLPSFVFGPGDMAQAHTADEWVALAQLTRAPETYTRLLSC